MPSRSKSVVWPDKGEFHCACRFVRREDFGEAEQIEWCGLHAKQRDQALTQSQAIDEAVAAERERWRGLVREALSADEGDYVLGKDLADRMRVALKA